MRRSPLTVAGVYAILDLPYGFELPVEEIVAALILGGARLIQLRAKQAEPGQRRAWAEAIVEPCRTARVPLIINDDLALAEGLLGVAGIHLGQGDLDQLGSDPIVRRERRERLREAGIALGVSTHDLAQVDRAINQLDPDYLGFGPVFSTTSKRDAERVVGLDGLGLACAESPVPVVAIGGIGPSRAGELAQTGVSAIAAIGALTGDTGEIIRDRTAALVRAFGG